MPAGPKGFQSRLCWVLALKELLVQRSYQTIIHHSEAALREEHVSCGIPCCLSSTVSAWPRIGTLIQVCIKEVMSGIKMDKVYTRHQRGAPSPTRGGRKRFFGRHCLKEVMTQKQKAVSEARERAFRAEDTAEAKVWGCEMLHEFGRTGEKGRFVPGAGTRLKRWAALRSVNFSLRVWERDRILRKQGREMLRSAFLKDPIPVWRTGGEGGRWGARQTEAQSCRV